MPPTLSLFPAREKKKNQKKNTKEQKSVEQRPWTKKMLLTSLLRISPTTTPDANEEPEDIFAAAALGTLFTDDLRNQHGGDPGSGTLIAYLSRRLGRALELGTADPAGEEERRKFAHYLWNAGVLMGELCGGRPAEGEEVGAGAAAAAVGEWRLEGGGRKGWWVEGGSGGEEGWWRVEGERVLELGAGG